jgi:ATP-dependent Lon protease
MPTLNEKLNDVFTGYVVRKDLVKLVRGNAAVPSYVLEYLLGQNAATDDEEQIKAGVERVKDILAEHYVQRAESGLIRSKIKETGYQRIIDKVSVDLNEKRDAYEATFENLGISQVLVSSDTVRQNQRLLVSGGWCIADLGYSPNEAKNESPYILSNLKPIQLAQFDFDFYCQCRSQFTSEEWVDVIVRTIGLDPEMLGKRDKLFQLTRLINYCERNYNFIELGPKGTGKSHVFSEFSPHGILISGGEVTPAKLFVNNSTGKIGLVGFWDCVAFDEFAGKQKRPKPDIVDIMKNYMANKSFSRGIEQVTAEASMAFVGNTSHDIGYMIANTDLFEDLPAMYHDPAFIDRIHAYVPGWEMAIIRGEMFSADYGFIVDYLAEALRHLRALDFSGLYREHFELDSSLSTRDKDGINKTFSGLVKIIYPGKDVTAEEARELLEFAMEMRKRVKDQLYRLDETFERVEFRYTDKDSGLYQVTTLEEVEYAEVYHSLDRVPYDGEVAAAAIESRAVAASATAAAPASGAAAKPAAAQTPNRAKELRKPIVRAAEAAEGAFVPSTNVATLDDARKLLMHYYNNKPSFSDDIYELIGYLDDYQRNHIIAVEYIDKRFPPPQMTHDRFMVELTAWQQAYLRLIVKGADIIGMATRRSAKRGEVLANICAGAESFSQKIEELSLVLVDTYTGEAGGDATTKEIEDLVGDMQELIESIKEYE